MLTTKQIPNSVVDYISETKIYINRLGESIGSDANVVTLVFTQMNRASCERTSKISQIAASNLNIYEF